MSQNLLLISVPINIGTELIFATRLYFSFFKELYILSKISFFKTGCKSTTFI